MKYLVLIPDGMADRPIAQLCGKTPMEAAKKPCMDRLFNAARCRGTVSNVPEGMTPESDTANLAILSYDPKIYSRGRSPLEAASMGIELKPDEVAMRCNLVTLTEEENYLDRTMVDHSADEITTAEADELVTALNRALGNSDRHIYTGVSYRHCLVWRDDDDNYPFMRPHDILGQKIKDYLPGGERGQKYLDFMRDSSEVLKNHPVNLSRVARGLRPANSAWLWSPGRKPSLPSFKEKWGLDGAIVCAVDLISGIGKCAGMYVPKIKGVTGNFNTDYNAKANAAISAFEGGADFVYIHVEAPDECGHRAETENKVRSIELIDEKILAPLTEYLNGKNERFRIMVLPDHPTPVEIRTHSMEPVPFFIYDSDDDNNNSDGDSNKRGENGLFSEKTCEAEGNYIDSGYRLLEHLIL